MLGDYSEFENICKVLVFQHVSHSSYARHLQKMPSRYLGGVFSFLGRCRHCASFRHCRLDRQSLDRQSGGVEMPDRSRA